ncbi:phage tail tape measure protein, partial [Rhodobacteraceae bacterium PA1-206B]
MGLDAAAFETGLKKAGGRTKSFERDVNKATGSVSAAMQKASSSAVSFAKAFATGFAGGIVATALAGLNSNINDTVKSIAALGDEAKRSGLGLEAFQEWKFVAEQNRIGIDALVDGFKELSLRADEFIVTGGGSASEAFKRLGYSAADLGKKLKDPSALMLEIIGRLEGLDRAAQIRIADELFGGTGGEQFVQLLDQGEAGISRTIDRARELGIVMDRELIEKAQELDRRWQELNTTIGTWFK